MKASGLVWLGLVWWDWQLDGKIFFMPLLRQESVRERQGDTQHEGEWFGLARFGFVWWDWQLDGRIFFMPLLRQESVRERQGNTQHEVSGLVWLGLDWWDLQRKDRSSSCHATSGICQRTARRYLA
jgi:hypothetical protein